jgi:hypothetical protein
MGQYFKIQHPLLLPMGRIILALPFFLLFYGPLYLNLFFILIGGFALWLAFHAGRNKEAFEAPHFLYRRIARFCLWAFMIIGLLQLVPVPAFVMKIVSPQTMDVLKNFQDSLPLLTTFSLAPADTLHQWMQIGGIVLCCGLTVSLRFGLTDVRELLKTIVVSGLVLVVCGSLFYWAANILSSHYLDFLLPLRSRMTFYVGMCLPVSISILLSRMRYIGSRRGFIGKLRQVAKEDRLIWGYLGVPFALLVFVIVASAGAGLLAVLVPVALYFLTLTYLRMARPLRRKLRYVFVSVAMFALMVGMVKMGSEDTHFNGREIAGEIAVDFPILGTGLGTFPAVARYYSYQYEGFPPLNGGGDFLESAAESGVPASIFLFGFFITWMAGMTRMWWARRHPDVKIIGLGILCGMLVGLLHSLFLSSLHFPPQLFLLGLFMVIGIKTVTYKKDFPVE